MTRPVLTPYYGGVGDDWLVPFTYRNPPAADGTPGTPIDLTGSIVGGELYLTGHNAPVIDTRFAPVTPPP